MQSNPEAYVAYEAFSLDKSPALVNRKIHDEHPHEMCTTHLPHAGSDDSIASRLPFPTAAICRNDTVGAVRLVGFFDIFVPDWTRLRFAKAGILQRVLMLTVIPFLLHFIFWRDLRVLVILPDFSVQVSAFWILNISLTLQHITSCIQSSLWLLRQSEQARYSSYIYRTQLDAIWASQQVVNMMLIPMLTLRKFNGQAHNHNRNVSHQSHTHCMLCSQLVCLALAPCASLRHSVSAVVLALTIHEMPFSQHNAWCQVQRELYLQALRLFCCLVTN